MSTLKIAHKHIAVSVIVPVHNTGKLLAECVSSILNQSLNNIELICVDDGSTDDSLEILRGFSRIDSRVIIFQNSKNSGPGVSRNEGITIARGEYISFVDSDDWINKDCLKTMYESAKKYNTDLTLCQITNFDQRTGQFYTRSEFLHTVPERFTNMAFSWRDISRDIFCVPLNPVSKLYRRDFLLRNDIKFSDTYFLEDHAFCLKVTLLARHISYIPERFYVYRTNHKFSLSHTNDYKLLQCFPEYRKLERVLLESGLVELAPQVLFYIIQSAALRSLGVEYGWRPDYTRIARKFFQDSKLLHEVDYAELSGMVRDFLHNLFFHMGDKNSIDPLHFKHHHQQH